MNLFKKRDPQVFSVDYFCVKHNHTTKLLLKVGEIPQCEMCIEDHVRKVEADFLSRNINRQQLKPSYSVKRFLFLPLFFPQKISNVIERMNPKPLIYDTFGNKLEVCSTPVLHKISGKRCVWCKKSIQELHNQVEESHLYNPQKNINIEPQPDFNSLTSVTVNVPKKNIIVEDLDPAPDPVMSNVYAYCLKCRQKVLVVDPKFEDVELRKGIRTYCKGSCSVCRSKINAISKRGD